MPSSIRHMSIAIVAASGLLGRILSSYFENQGFKVFPVKHTAIDQIPPVDIVINLAGVNIAGGLWTPSYKKKIWESRVETTKRLAQKISPELYIGASAIGFFGNSGETLVDESSPKGSGFLADLVNEWEKASQDLSCRKVFLRMAPILTKKGGFLGKMVPLYKWGLGALLGSGKAWQSWIHYLDFARAVHHIINVKTLSGPLILASPHPVRQKAFGKVLAHQLKRPFFFKIPSFAFHLLPGGMGKELFLSSCRAFPKALVDSGFVFRFPDIETALQDLLPPL